MGSTFWKIGVSPRLLDTPPVWSGWPFWIPTRSNRIRQHIGAVRSATGMRICTYVSSVSFPDWCSSLWNPKILFDVLRFWFSGEMKLLVACLQRGEQYPTTIGPFMKAHGGIKVQLESLLDKAIASAEAALFDLVPLTGSSGLSCCSTFQCLLPSCYTSIGRKTLIMAVWRHRS